jgi:hypothetical protein
MPGKIRYTQEQIDFLSRLREKGLSGSEINELYFIEYGIQRNMASINQILRRKGSNSNKRKCGLRIDESQKAFLSELSDKISDTKEITRLFNAKFGLNFTPIQINAKLYRKNIRCGKKPRRYSKQEIEYLSELAAKMGSNEISKKQIQELFNNNFNASLPQKELISKMVKLKLLDKKKVREYSTIWKKANGPIPNNCLIVFLDGNKDNIRLENMDLIYCRRRKKQFYEMIKGSEDIELNKTILLELNLKSKIRSIVTKRNKGLPGKK